jgi:hypothetical protein
MQPLRCPVCKAENAQGPLCRRCKADLSLLFTLEEQRDQALASARLALHQGDRETLLTRATRADALRSDDESRRLLALARLVHGDYAGAVQTARRVPGKRTEQRNE